MDDYSQFTWVKFLASKDEALDFIIKFLKMIQVRLNATVRNIRTDNGTEFVNQTLRDYYEQVGISHETSVARTPQQNGVVERKIDADCQCMTPATPIFDEFFSPPASVASSVPVEETSSHVESTGSSSSTIKLFLKNPHHRMFPSTSVHLDAPDFTDVDDGQNLFFRTTDFTESLLDHKIQQLSKGSSEGSGTTPEVPDEPKDNSVVAEKQAGYVQTNLTMSSVELEIQSMVDVPIHQEDLAV
ncbi:retrovirus-related pol polyprotein from transposon TNT 1-94 [Tanacetum coccineum]